MSEANEEYHPAPDSAPAPDGSANLEARMEAKRMETSETTIVQQENSFLDVIEDLARQHCFTDTKVRTYHDVPEFNVTDSGGISTDADALRTLAKHARFRIVREYGRMVVGYWPENDPNNGVTGVTTAGR
jgi:hypothetical protein